MQSGALGHVAASRWVGIESAAVGPSRGSSGQRLAVRWARLQPGKTAAEAPVVGGGADAASSADQSRNLVFT